MIYICEACHKECTPVLRDVGPSADCCEEARLTIGGPAAFNEGDVVKFEKWNSHRQPQGQLEGIVTKKHLNPYNGTVSLTIVANGKPYFRIATELFRPLTRDEERELAYELHDEADAERTPADRVRNNWLNRS